MRRREQPAGYKIDLGFGDAADPGAIQEINMNFAPCIGDPNAKTNWREGIDLIRSFMKMQQIGEADEFGTPLEALRFFVDPSCVNTINEFNNYKSPTPVKGKNVTESGIKADDHAIDALRYGLMHVFKLGAQHHLNEVVQANNITGSSGGGQYGNDGGFFTTEQSF